MSKCCSSQRALRFFASLGKLLLTMPGSRKDAKNRKARKRKTNLLTGVRALQIFIQEAQNRLVSPNLISLLGKAMSFVVKHYVFNDATLLLYSLYDFIGFRLDHSRII